VNGFNNKDNKDNNKDNNKDTLIKDSLFALAKGGGSRQ